MANITRFDPVGEMVSLRSAKADDVEITMTGQNLSIRGEFKAGDGVGRDQYLYRERRFGRFSRSIQLPVRVQGDRADATFRDGVLSLHIPKAEEVKPRQIRINAGVDETSENGTGS